MNASFLFGLLVPLGLANPPPVEPVDDGDAVCALLYARPFRLDRPHDYPWMRGHPPVTEGLIVVVEVDPKLARLRQVASPVLYVGDTPAERVNIAASEGRVVLIVPGRPDLTQMPVYLGSVELPERVDAQRGALELEAARAVGVEPFDETEVQAAYARGGAELHLSGSAALYHAAADLVEVWSPEDADQADNLRAPAP
ncbi:MAG: hypothetical protein JXB39_09560 [Deltaproteobacteria bacterium]|nr:hypothetical protein [Deltaproteobacteria bacterium]